MENIPSSFRDPSGFVFKSSGVIYRQINNCYKETYDYLIDSGLYETLVEQDLLIPHKLVDLESPSPKTAYKIIQPEAVPFISYPYEWSFSQLKYAALATLKIQKIALKFGMSLKDSSGYNIQFRKGKPLLIDTLSFEKYIKCEPWVAYGQFCQHFFAPLVLMYYKDIRLSQLLRIYIDGIPMDLASSLLPLRTYLRPSLFLNIHLHSKNQKKYSTRCHSIKTTKLKLSHFALLSLIDSLETAIKKINWKPAGTQWFDYYKNTSYSSGAFHHKRQIVLEFLDRINPKVVWDLGSNAGIFSRLVSSKKILTISFDFDPAAVEMNYLNCLKNREENLLPLLIDLANPSHGIGWENEERLSLLERGPADTVMALALLHHLVFSNNLSLSKVASFFNKICNSLIIEFIPKQDPQLRTLLATKKSASHDYTQESFEHEFTKYFTIKQSAKIKDSERSIYLFNK